MGSQAQLDELTARQRAVLREVTARGFVSTAELSAMTAVSDMTVRRDTRKLERLGLVKVVHGGVTLTHGPLHTAGFAERVREGADEKARVAAACRRLVSERDVVLIDAGTTCFAVASALEADFHGTVITHSAPVLQLALAAQWGSTICLGGELIHDSQAFIGDGTVSSLRGLRADVAVIGAAAVDLDGLYADRALEVPTKRALLEHGARTVLVVTADKLSSSAPVRMGQLDDVDCLVTDAPVTGAMAEALEAAGVEVIVADEDPSTMDAG